MSDEIIALNCFVLGDLPSQIFQIEIARNRTVSSLRKAVKKDNEHTFRDVDASDLQTYQVSVSEKDFATKLEPFLDPAQVPDANILSRPLVKLETIFSSPKEEHVHVIIAPPPGVPATRKRPSSAGDGGSDNKRSKSDVPHPLKNFPNEAPSTQTTADHFERMQKNDGPWIFCNRPQNAVSFPIPLLHPALGQFIDDATNSIPTAKDNAFASALSYQMSGFYPNEIARSWVFIQLMWEHYGIQLEAGTVPGTDYRTDGCHRIGNYPINISEVNPETGSRGGDPMLQAGVHHLQFLKNIRVLASNSSLPCLNIFYFGPFIGFAGSAMKSSRLHLEVLIPIFPLCTSSHDTPIRLAIARAFHAFDLAMKSLRKHYADEIRTIAPFPHDAQAQLPYPYPRQYNKRDNSGAVGFTYVSEGPAGRMTYFAKTDNGEQICVKYTRTYSEELHNYCASNGSAPPLHACERLPGNWLMIVMDAIDLSVYTLLSEIPNDVRPTVNAQLLPAVEKLVKGFHEVGLVHGDIRRNNILANDSGFLLIDFDWAGRVGDIRYPSNVNHNGVSRPEDARDGELITIKHDLEMLYSAFSEK